MIRKFIGAGSGTLAAQILALAVLPLVSRIYTPEAIGAWQLWLGAAFIIGSVATLRYDLAIVIAPCTEEAGAVFWLCILFSISISVLLAAALLIVPVRVLFGETVGVPRVITWVAPLMVFLYAFLLVLQAWCTRFARFWLLSFSQIVVGASTLTIQTAGGILSNGSAGWLAVGNITGQLAGSILLVLGMAYGRYTPAAPTLAQLKSAIVTYPAFPFYSTPYTLFGVLRERASLQVMQNYVAPNAIGQYALIYRIMNAPVTLISSALRPVIFRETAAHGVASAEKTLRRILFILMLLTVPSLALFVSMPGEWLALVFGTSWRETGDLGLYLTAPVYTFLLCNWLDRTMDVMGRQSLTLLLEVVFSVLSLLGMAAAFAWEAGLTGAVATQCFVLTTYNVTYLTVFFYCAHYKIRGLVLLGLASIGIFSISYLIVRLLQTVMDSWYAAIVFIACGCMIAAFMAVIYALRWRVGRLPGRSA